MNYMKIDDCDLNNGDGARVVLWVSGCYFQCDECHNKDAWDFNAGKPFTEESVLLLLKLLSDKYISGLSILGGEPLAPQNRDCIIKLCSRIKNELPDKDIWLWTGYDIVDYNAIGHLEIPDVDYIIDGYYDKNKPTHKKWRGSDNQRMFRKRKDKLILID